MPRILGHSLQSCFSRPKTIVSSRFPPPPFLLNDQSSQSHPSTSSLPSPFTPSTSEFFSSDSDTESITTDFATILASQRFFVSSPGRSNSIIDSFQELSETKKTVVVGGIPIPTYSPDPYVDFRHSIMEMVQARELYDVKADWDCLHELLLCYLALNPQHIHKYIVAAFTDVLINLTSSSTCSDTPPLQSGCPVSSQLGT
ncbi:hypothetical protein ACHQM5_014766 [Ranunculus cassubicifolius]